MASCFMSVKVVLLKNLVTWVLTIFLCLMHFVVCRGTCLSIPQLPIQPTLT